MLEGWAAATGLGLAAGTAVAGIAGSVISSDAQSNAAASAANAQESAANEQIGVQTGQFNAAQNQTYGARASGAEAENQLLSELGLAPVNQAGSTSIATMGTNGQLSYSVPGSSNTNSSPYNLAGTPGNTPGPNGVNQGSPLGSSWTNNGTPTNGMALTPQNSGTTQVTGGASTPSGGNAYTMFNASGQPTTVANGGSTGVNPISGTPNSVQGSGGTGSLSSVYNPSSFYLSPDYQFQMEQGLNAVQAQGAAAGHSSVSGNQEMAALNYSSGLAAGDYNQAFNNSLAAQEQQYNQLMGVVNVGQGGTGQVLGAGQAAASGVTSGIAGYGNAAAAGAIGQGNAVSSGVNTATGGINTAGFLNAYGQNAALNPYGSQVTNQADVNAIGTGATTTTVGQQTATGLGYNLQG